MISHAAYSCCGSRYVHGVKHDCKGRGVVTAHGNGPLATARSNGAHPAPLRAGKTYPVPALCREMGIPEPTAEVRFHPSRKWRFDWAWEAAKVALEIDGGLFANGRHTRGAGFRADMEKFNHAAALGWRVFRSEPEQLRIRNALALIRGAMEAT